MRVRAGPPLSRRRRLCHSRNWPPSFATSPPIPDGQPYCTRTAAIISDMSDSSAAAGQSSGHRHTKHQGRQEDSPGLVPRHLNYGDVTTPFIYNTVSALQWISDDPTVEQYVSSHPEDHRAILALSRSITEVGLRVRAAHKDAKAYDEHLRQFTAEEIWMVDLAADVVAMFAGGGGLRSDTRASVFDRLKRVDEHSRSHHWKAQVRKAGEGPAEFRQLRASIPHHEPHG
jgi:hypothetical protein